MSEVEEREGAKWTKHTDDFLVGYSAQNTYNPHAAAAEMQRRLKDAIKDFNQKFGEQAATMIALTRWIIALTIALGVIAGLQLWAMLRGAA